MFCFESLEINKKKGIRIPWSPVATNSYIFSPSL